MSLSKRTHPLDVQNEERAGDDGCVDRELAFGQAGQRQLGRGAGAAEAACSISTW